MPAVASLGRIGRRTGARGGMWPNPYGAALGSIDHGRGDLPMVDQPERAVAEPAPCRDRDRVGDAPVRLDECVETLVTSRELDAEQLAGEEAEAYAEDLARAEMAVQ